MCSSEGCRQNRAMRFLSDAGQSVIAARGGVTSPLADLARHPEPSTWAAKAAQSDRRETRAVPAGGPPA